MQLPTRPKPKVLTDLVGLVCGEIEELRERNVRDRSPGMIEGVCKPTHSAMNSDIRYGLHGQRGMPGKLGLSG